LPDPTFLKAASIEDADCIRLVPHQHRGQGEIVPLVKRVPSQPMSYTFNYQRDTYVVVKSSPIAFTRLPYPCTSRPPLSDFLAPPGLATTQTDPLKSLYGKNEFNIPIPSFAELFGEHATAPFFVFQIFCVALWCLDEYWYYSIFTLFMLVMFECTVVWQVRRLRCAPSFALTVMIQRVKTLTEFRTMSVAPYPIMCLRDSKWVTLQTDELLPGDVVSVG
jgi:cation-transporting ATPase 13A1